ncbi:hypothetical protein [Deinococcus aluminii]|uniref:Uncharacterized protein n=1 Tax=Deinococcus aluminii TaxID=1656885 RepID=A0ABP9XEU8_9DEIO
MRTTRRPDKLMFALKAYFALLALLSLPMAFIIGAVSPPGTMPVPQCVIGLLLIAALAVASFRFCSRVDARLNLRLTPVLTGFLAFLAALHLMALLGVLF